VGDIEKDVEMPDNTSDQTRIENEKLKQQRFREEFIAGVPSWYRGEAQVAILLLLPAGTIYYCWIQIAGATWIEWSMISPILLLGNFIEWAAHRYLLHGRVKGFELAFRRHAGVHHHFFTQHNMLYKGHKELLAQLFPPYAVVGFIVIGIPPALLVGYLWSANVAYIIVTAMAANYLVYEGLHTVSHLDDARHPYLKYLPLVNTVRRMHRVHHNLRFMQTHNFNLTWPIADVIMGTSDLNRGLIGTLFNGENETYAQKDPRLEEEPPQFNDWGTDKSSFRQFGKAAQTG
jgi:hypothetical protein